MNTEEKIYSLMAQAEDMQAHAESSRMGQRRRLQVYPLPLSKRGKNTLYGAARALFLLAVGVVVATIAVAGIWWGTSSLR